ncbi:MAG: hypothetical protein ACI845_004127 [Gammaproteobacteria bacterium]|jgi:hypothetical protein
MAKFILVYHGGTMPETQEEGMKVMAQWQAWLGGMGDAVVDAGNPVGLSSTVHSNGSVTADGGANPVSGYSIISADDLDAATALAKGCPVFEAAGSVEVAELMEM